VLWGGRKEQNSSDTAVGAAMVVKKNKLLVWGFLSLFDNNNHLGDEGDFLK